ncbi:hypothetical protein BDW42DRAFT_179645 [Aspergillus taichungensis]|uniref:Uncharacterized protein n=1 Tax=Aspergillus taichungensis TaxID=482145 RepID=A0A2J5HGJ0_9EURO|nr:hypothetical protein BDW42DRAFT_179645 [Aspergillus taichungensis]
MQFRHKAWGDPRHRQKLWRHLGIGMTEGNGMRCDDTSPESSRKVTRSDRNLGKRIQT